MRLLQFAIVAIVCFSMACKTTETKIDNFQMPFPEAWIGHWQGDLTIFNSKGVAATVKNQLIVAPTDTPNVYKWVIIYGEGEKEDRRDYRLEIRDPSKGLYAIDERNSITMESYLMGNRFLSWFEVEGTTLLCTYDMQGRNIIFEVNVCSSAPVSSTGNTIRGTDTIPVVKTYPIRGFQRSVMSRVEEAKKK